MTRTHCTSLLTLSCALALVACGGETAQDNPDTPAAALAQLDLTLDLDTVALGGEIVATVRGTYDDATTKDLTAEAAWESADPSVLEAIADPMIHLIRNAVDHGIEEPEERVGQGKPPQGRLSLRAYHEGGYVHVVVSDDGRGIDAAALGRRALELGLISSAQLERLPER